MASGATTAGWDERARNSAACPQADNATCPRAGERQAGAPLRVGELPEVVLWRQPSVAGADDGSPEVDDACLTPSPQLCLPISEQRRRRHDQDSLRLAGRDERVDGGEHLERLP